MNILLAVIIENLESIDNGLKGIITLSENLENVIDCVFYNRVPASWTKWAFVSKRCLATWLNNMFQRCE